MATKKSTTKAATTTTKPKAVKSKSASTATTEKKPSAPRKTDKYVRNLRGMTVHARLFSKNPKDPFRISLSPRGQHGDSTMVPADLTNDPTFVQGVGVLFEIITRTEFENAQYQGQVGYLQRDDAPKVIRPEDTTAVTAPNWDGKGRLPQDRELRRTSTGKQASEREFGTGMHTADTPGSDTALHNMLKAGQDALPADVDLSSRRVTIERVKGA